MSTQAQDKEQAEQSSRQERQQRIEAIGKNILLALGQPDDLHRVQVRLLWGDHFRANVFTGADFVTAKIVHSYFVIADAAGNLVTTVPPIKQKYGLATTPNGGR